MAFWQCGIGSEVGTQSADSNCEGFFSFVCEETEVQRGKGNCLKSHSSVRVSEAGKLGWEHKYQNDPSCLCSSPTHRTNGNATSCIAWSCKPDWGGKGMKNGQARRQQTGKLVPSGPCLL